jgi:glutamate dehydrogenase (NAD(P)+)
MHAARFLKERGAVLVGASDSRGAVYQASGLDVEALVQVKAAGGSLAEHGPGASADPNAVLDMECDVWIPAARPDVIREDNVHRLRTRMVAQGANIPCTPGAERALAERGVLVLPDFIANAGGVICAAVEYRGGAVAEAFETIETKIRDNVGRMLSIVRETKVLPREAAVSIAKERLGSAAGYRRWR